MTPQEGVPEPPYWLSQMEGKKGRGREGPEKFQCSITKNGGRLFIGLNESLFSWIFKEGITNI